MIGDRSGVMDLPIKLAVCFLVIGIMTPILLDSVERAEDGIELTEIREEALGLKEGICKAYYSGGTTISVDISLGTGHSIAAGGSGAERYALRLISNGTEIDRMFLDSPPIPILGSEKILEGDMTIRLQAQDENGSYGVMILDDRIHIVQGGAVHMLCGHTLRMHGDNGRCRG